MEINQVMIAEVESLSQEQLDFRSLHCEIIRAGNMAADACIMYAYKLKEMRDSKKYRAVGCETFGEYCKTVCNLNERQIYNYISVVEKLDKDFLQTSAKISMSNLITLASMNGTDRAELLEENDITELESMSSRELDKLKAAHEARVQQLTMQLETVDKENDELRADVSSASNDIMSKNKEIVKANEDLRSKTIEIGKAKNERDSKASEVIKLTKSIKEMQNAPREVQLEVDTDSQEKLSKAEQRLAKMEEQAKEASLAYDKLQKKLDMSSDKALTTFGVKFKDLQSIWIEIVVLLEGLDVDKKEKCTTALKQVIQGWEL